MPIDAEGQARLLSFEITQLFLHFEHGGLQTGNNAAERAQHFENEIIAFF